MSAMVRILATGVLVLALLAAEPARASAPGASPADPRVIHTLPYGGSIPRPAPLTVGSGPLADAVAGRCNGGTPIHAPVWFDYTPPEAQDLVAFVVARSSTPPNSPAGVAILDVDGEVLACHSAPDADTTAQAGPVRVDAGARLRVVAYVASPSESAATSGTGIAVYVAAPPGPPANDEVEDATQIGALPYRAAIDTTLATTSPADPVIEGCVDGRLAGTVWWSYRPARTEEVTVSVDGARAVLLRDAGDGFEPVGSCERASTVTATLRAGERYLVYVYGEGTAGYAVLVWGGPVTLAVETTPAPPALEQLRVHRIGSVDAQTGTARVSGSVTCTSDGRSDATVGGQLSRTRAEVTVAGTFTTDVPCHGRRTRWSAEVAVLGGRFERGWTTLDVGAEVCNVTGCDRARRTEHVWLHQRR